MEQKQPSCLLALGFILIILPIVGSIFIVMNHFEIRHIEKNGVVAQAEIVDKEETHGFLGSTSYYISYQYRYLLNGVEGEHTKVSKYVDRAFYDSVPLGSQITIKYHPENPMDSIIEGQEAKLGSFQVIANLSILAIGILFAYLSKYMPQV